MAKVKEIKERLRAVLKAKGFEAAEINAELEQLDQADLELADALTKNTQWNEWYTSAAPEIQKIAQERDSYKSKVEKLQQAGLSFEQAAAVAQGAPNTSGQPAQAQYVTQDSLREFQNSIAKASSDVMKDLIKLNFKHFKEFGSEADLDAIENLMKEDPQTGRRKAYTVDEAYRMWSEPEYAKKRETETQKKIDEGIKAGVQAELSKHNVPGIRRQKTQKDIIGVENAPLDKPAPSDRDLRSAFMSDLNEETTH